jgi:hypothetical protein
MLRYRPVFAYNHAAWVGRGLAPAASVGSLRLVRSDTHGGGSVAEAPPVAEEAR